MKRTQVLLSLDPVPGNARNSEGDFLRLRDGSIIIIYTQYTTDEYGDSTPTRIVSRVSRDNGESWSDYRVVLEPEKFGAINVSSVSLMRMQNGDVGMLFLIKREGDRNWHRDIYLARSRDECESFYSFTDCTPGDYIGKYCVNNSRLRRLSSGRLIYPLSLHPGCQKADTGAERRAGATSHTLGAFMYSDDDGYTWKRSAEYVFPPFTAGNAGIQEGEIYEICPGVIKCLFRTDKMYQYESMSLDDGDHWTVPQPSIFTGPCSPISLSKNPYSGKIYAFWNPIPVHNGRSGSKERPARSPLAVAEVGKNLSNLEWMDIAEEDRSAGYAYTAIFYTNENEALIAYCAGKPTEDRGMLCRLNISRVCLTPAPDVPKSIF